MIDLSRRSFFKGLAATLVATAALPKIPLEYKPAFDEWIAAVVCLPTDKLKGLL